MDLFNPPAAEIGRLLCSPVAAGDERAVQDVFVDDPAVLRQMQHVRSLALWPLRGPWWYFVRRRRQANLEVEQQYRLRRLTGWEPGMRFGTGDSAHRKSA